MLVMFLIFSCFFVFSSSGSMDCYFAAVDNQSSGGRV